MCCCFYYYFLRELAFQISEQFEALGSSIGVKCGMLVKKLNDDMHVILMPFYNITNHVDSNH